LEIELRFNLEMIFMLAYSPAVESSENVFMAQLMRAYGLYFSDLGIYNRCLELLLSFVVIR
jgi:hypothetical protein